MSDSSDIDFLKQKEIDKLIKTQNDRKTRKEEKTPDPNKRQYSVDDNMHMQEPSRRVTLKDFNMNKLVGKGSFGKVISYKKTTFFFIYF